MKQPVLLNKIKQIIQNAEKEDIHKVAFLFSNPDTNENIFDNENIKEIISILDKYQIMYNKVDTIQGQFNMNRDWIETETPIKAVSCYCGVYPINWKIEDCLTIEQLEYSGKLLIRAYLVDDKGKYLEDNYVF